METKNYGLRIDPIAPEDFLGGSSQSLRAKYGAAVINPDGDWTPYLPTTENQDTSDGDTWACASFGTSNAVEMLARLNFKESKNLSDRFLAKVSGTIVGQGNSPKTVADTLRHKWTVDEPEWPDVDTVEEYYAEPPASLKTVAVARGAEFEFGYQYIPNNQASIKTALKSSPVCIAVTAWHQENGVYTRIKGIAENHWTTIIKVLDNGNFKVFDSFPPFIKEVRPECAQSVAMSYYLNRNVVVENAWTRFVKAILALFRQPAGQALGGATCPVEAPATPSTTPTPAAYDWSNPAACRHSARVIMDEMGLTGVVDKATGLKAKDLLCACIMQESEWNPKAIGKPNHDGTIDYGLCQYNNGKLKGIPLWIGKGAAFANTTEVLNNPEKNVRIMVKTYQAGHLNWWASYSTGAYKKWL